MFLEKPKLIANVIGGCSESAAASSPKTADSLRRKRSNQCIYTPSAARRVWHFYVFRLVSRLPNLATSTRRRKTPLSRTQNERGARAEQEAVGSQFVRARAVIIPADYCMLLLLRGGCAMPESRWRMERGGRFGEPKISFLRLSLAACIITPRAAA